MVRFLVIIFDGASEDVPNEDLTLIKDEFSLPFLISFFLSRLFSSLINDKTTRDVVMVIRFAEQKEEFVKRSNLLRTAIIAKVTKIKSYYTDEVNIKLKYLI